MAFLQELKSGILATQVELNTLSSQGADIFVAEAKYSALLEIYDYVRRGSWSRYEDFAHRINVILEQGTKKAVEVLNLTDLAHARVLLRRANKSLEKILGTDLIVRILEGKCDEAMLDFRLRTGACLSDRFFVKEAKDLLPSSDDSVEFTLKDCIREAKFLAFYSRSTLNKRFKDLNKQKLAYLVSLLDGYKSDLLPEQQALIRFVNGEISADMLSSTINPFKQSQELSKSSDTFSPEEDGSES